MDNIIALKIKEIKKVEDLFPGIFYLFDLKHNRIVYANENTCRAMRKTLEEIQELDEEYYAQTLAPGNEEYYPALLQEVYETRNEEGLNCFVKGRFHLEEDFHWFILIFKYSTSLDLIICHVIPLSELSTMSGSLSNLLDDYLDLQEKDHFGNLTNREKEVLELVSRGLTSKEISQNLGISKNTVDIHRKNILKKLNIENPARLISYYRIANWL